MRKKPLGRERRKCRTMFDMNWHAENLRRSAGIENSDLDVY